ncbi:UNVERIFIED_CONTAM: hypothetical protein HDU68_004897 [Siphonaria sp. JEL0065]|nr:hypothetical protein HDU68_004897 [Siphonaria sp. JEL0065]
MPNINFFAKDMSSNATTTDANDLADSIEGAIILHGLAMFVAFAVFPVAAIFSARYLQKKRYWLWLHISMNLLTVIMMVLGLWLIEFAVDSPFSFKSVHGSLGTMLTLCILPIQLLLGAYTAFKRDNSRTVSPLHVKFHRWTGRILLFVTIAEIQLGIVAADFSPQVSAGLWSWLLTVVSLFLVMGKKPINHREMPPLPSEPLQMTGTQTMMKRLGAFKSQFTGRRKQLRNNSTSTTNQTLTRHGTMGGISTATLGSNGSSSPNETIPMRTIVSHFNSRINKTFSSVKIGSSISTNSFTLPYQHTNTTASSSSPLPHRIVYNEPEEASDSDFLRPTARKLFSEPDEVSILSRRLTAVDAPPLPPTDQQRQRIVCAEPDDVSLTRPSSVTSRIEYDFVGTPPTQVHRVVFEEPQDLSTLSRRSTQGPNRAVNRVFFEEPDEI